MTTANIVAWLVIGGIAGLLVAIMGRRQESFGRVLLDVLFGVVGGFIGGVILNALGGIVGAEVVGVNLGGAVIAILGAVILVIALEWLFRSTQT
jgi:uncharacterized membrane protein YeaQ/YmgE (transglycosylase-associated protein family)